MGRQMVRERMKVGEDLKLADCRAPAKNTNRMSNVIVFQNGDRETYSFKTQLEVTSM